MFCISVMKLLSVFLLHLLALIFYYKYIELIDRDTSHVFGKEWDEFDFFQVIN